MKSDLEKNKEQINTEKQEPKSNDKKSIKKKKNRCTCCNKKIGLIVYTCKCGNIYCQTHLSPHNHNCQFDYIKEKKDQLIKQNPKLGSKFEKI